jgi:hypothetical protein
MVLQGDTCHRVAKNPLKYASVDALIFEGLQALSRPGYKVMFCVRALTVHFPLVAPGTPTWISLPTSLDLIRRQATLLAKTLQKRRQINP